MDIVQNILSIAKEKKITDQQLCKILKTNPSKIYDWKKGKSKPSANDIAVLAEYFNVSADFLVGRTDISLHSAEPYDLDEEMIVINRAARKASPDQRKRMTKLLKAGFEDLFENENEDIDEDE